MEKRKEKNRPVSKMRGVERLVRFSLDSGRLQLAQNHGKPVLLSGSNPRTSAIYKPKHLVLILGTNLRRIVFRDS